MRRAPCTALLVVAASFASGQTTTGPPPVTPSPTPSPPLDAEDPFWTGFRAAIGRNLGKPYVWGATGQKSFDCSGFLWRVMTESGIFIKRTTARRYYLTLPKVDEKDAARFGTVVFFSDLDHVGIVNDRASFYHAACTKGTHLAPFTPYWRSLVYGYRAIPRPRPTPTPQPPTSPTPAPPSR